MATQERVPSPNRSFFDIPDKGDILDKRNLENQTAISTIPEFPRALKTPRAELICIND